MVISMMENGLMASIRVRASINGILVRVMRVNGRIISSMVREFKLIKIRRCLRSLLLMARRLRRRRLNEDETLFYLLLIHL
jgi:hypothetical protein